MVSALPTGYWVTYRRGQFAMSKVWRITALHRPHLGQLVLAEADGGAEHQLAELALVADLAELLDDPVEHRHRMERRCRCPVGGMGESLRTDVRIAECRFDCHGGPPSVRRKSLTRQSPRTSAGGAAQTSRRGSRPRPPIDGLRTVPLTRRAGCREPARASSARACRPSGSAVIMSTVIVGSTRIAAPLGRGAEHAE